MESKKIEHCKQILEFLDANGPSNFVEMRDNMDIPPASLFRRLKDMADAGHIQKPKRGTYSLPNQPDSDQFQLHIDGKLTLEGDTTYLQTSNQIQTSNQTSNHSNARPNAENQEMQEMEEMEEMEELLEGRLPGSYHNPLIDLDELKNDGKILMFRPGDVAIIGYKKQPTGITFLAMSNREGFLSRFKLDMDL